MCAHKFLSTRSNARKTARRTHLGLKRLAAFRKSDGRDRARSHRTPSVMGSRRTFAAGIRDCSCGAVSGSGQESATLPSRIEESFSKNWGSFFLTEEWVVFSRMLTGDRPVAWHYGFVFGGSWFWYQPTFDSVVEKHWPGFCLLSQVIQDAIETPGMKMLDLGLGSEIYKVKFANQHAKHFDITVSAFQDSALRTRSARHNAAEWVKKSPRSERAVIAFRDFARKASGTNP